MSKTNNAPSPGSGNGGPYSGSSLSYGAGIAALLFLAAAAMRIYLAWGNRFMLKADFGVVALMAKHMAEGLHFPFYLYGQAYIGSLEAAASAFFCRFFGCSEFTVSLGTALCGFLVLPVIYYWARQIGGRRAGLAALAFCVIGPELFTYYSVFTVGSWALNFFFVTALLAMACHLVQSEVEGQAVSWLGFFLLGFVGGLGWWNYQMIFTALLTASLLFLLTPGFRIFRVRVLSGGLIGFVLGSLPFWWWNLHNNWSTFKLSQSFETLQFQDNFQDFSTRHLAYVLGLPTDPPWWGILLFGALVITGFLLVVDGLRRSPRVGRAQRIHLLAILLFVAVHLLVLSGSHFARLGSSRYLLPVVPSLAVLIGVATAALARRVPYGLGWTPLVMIIALQWRIFPGSREMTETAIEDQQAAHRLEAFLEKESLTSVYTRYESYGLNFALREKITFSDLRKERYRPYGITNETADRVAVLDNYGNISSFLAYGGGGATKTRFAGRFSTLHYNFTPPLRNVEEIPPARIRKVTDSQGLDLSQILTDRNIDTSWVSTLLPEESEYLEIVLEQPEQVSTLRILSPRHTGYPEYWILEGLAPGEDRWQTLSRAAEPSFYFWSGPRPFWAGEFYRLECRFVPRRLSRLRLRRTDNTRNWSWGASEVQIFTPRPGPDRPTEAEALPGLLHLLRERSIDRLYSDRWLAGAVHRTLGGTVFTNLESSLFQDDGGRLPSHVALTPRTAFIVRGGEASLTRSSLHARKFSLRETVIGPWVLFDFAPGGWRPEFSDFTGLHWAGFGGLQGYGKQFADALVRRAEQVSAKEGASPAALGLLEEAIRAYDNHLPALRKLISLYAEKGDQDRSNATALLYRERAVPEVPASIRFKGGPQFEGITLEKQVVNPGSTLGVTYYWTVPPRFSEKTLAVFVHFKKDRNAFQDDHRLLQETENSDLAFQPFAEVFQEHRSITVPSDTPPGTYNIFMGLLDPFTEKRIALHTDLPHKKNRVQLPLTLTVRNK